MLLGIFGGALFSSRYSNLNVKSSIEGEWKYLSR